MSISEVLIIGLLMFIVSGLYIAVSVSKILYLITPMYMKLTAVYNTGTGLKGTGTLPDTCVRTLGLGDIKYGTFGTAGLWGVKYRNVGI